MGLLDLYNKKLSAPPVEKPITQPGVQAISADG
jgi:hypothetical protein